MSSVRSRIDIVAAPTPKPRHWRSLLVPLGAFERAEWAVAVIATLAALALLGIPTAVVPTPLFGRTLETDAVNVAVWLASAPLIGILVATYAPSLRLTPVERSPVGRISTAGAAAYLAIGCPVCNKVLLVLLGTNGALQIFAPLQPLIGVLAVGSLTAMLVWRLRQLAVPRSACATPVPYG